MPPKWRPPARSWTRKPCPPRSRTLTGKKAAPSAAFFCFGVLDLAAMGVFVTKKPPFMAMLLLFVLAGMTGETMAQRKIPGSRPQIQLSFAPLVKRAAPAVVNIFTRKTVLTRQVSPLFDDPFFRRFFGENFSFGGGRRKKVQNSLGSGVLVNSRGRVVTNHHVIEGADEIRVVLADRREFEAKIVGTDERTDLAVLSINARGEKLPFLRFRDSDELEVGDLVLAIGNPFGVGQTVTSGIVSALARSQVGISDLNFFIQTDAAINPGNSGGALVGMDGRLAGINSAIFSRGGGSIGIGFAIPSNMVRSVISGISGTGKVVRPWFGGVSQAVGADMAASLGMRRPGGVLINDLYPGGPAQRAGLRRGDVVLEIGGREVNGPEALRYRMATHRLGARVTLKILRRGGTRNLTLPIEAPPEKPARNTTQLGGAHPLRGASIANLSPALATEVGMSPLRRGVILLAVGRGSQAGRLGFKPGDILVKLNGQEVPTVRIARNILARRARRWRISIERGGKTLSMTVNQ